MKNNVKHDVGKRICSVTWMPTFLLGLQGWVDSRKGEVSIPDARVEEMKNKCMAIEKREALIIESHYEPVHKEDSKAISKIAACKVMESTAVESDEDKSPYSIRKQVRGKDDE